ncbi:MAG TPA: energy-coupling factor ABC transporter permease, partial [Acidimicrobiales bacterium]
LAIGGTVDLHIADVAVAMVGTHVVIGIGEGVITALAVGAVLAARPDLVAGVASPAADLEIRAPMAEAAR